MESLSSKMNLFVERPFVDGAKCFPKIVHESWILARNHDFLYHVNCSSILGGLQVTRMFIYTQRNGLIDK